VAIERANEPITETVLLDDHGGKVIAAEEEEKEVGKKQVRFNIGESKPSSHVIKLRKLESSHRKSKSFSTECLKLL